MLGVVEHCVSQWEVAFGTAVMVKFSLKVVGTEVELLMGLMLVVANVDEKSGLPIVDVDRVSGLLEPVLASACVELAVVAY